MAIKFMDSFEQYGGDESAMQEGTYLQATFNSPGQLSNTRARTGTWSAFLQNGSTLRVVLDNRPTIAGAAMSLWFDALPGVSDRAAPIGFLDRDGNVNVFIGVDTTGALNAWRGDNVLLDTSAPVITSGAWQHLEARCKVDNAAGEVEIRVNGVTVLALSGVDTFSSFASQAEVAQIRVLSGIGVTQTPFYVDDFYIWDDQGSINNDFIGDRRVLTHYANQDTIIADFQKSSGVNGYALINESPPDDDASYIFAEFDEVGAQSAFEFEELGAEVSAVTAVQVNVRSYKTDAGAANIQASVITDYNEELGADNALTSVYTDRRDIFETNPDTGAPWTRDEINAALIAVRRTL